VSASTAEQSSAHRKVVALGGGHGLAASLTALRRITPELTAVVTVADNGGSSGRLRAELGVLPPGDLRQALAALCRDDEWGRTWAEVLQHRFPSGGPLHEHAVGNLLIVALWDLLGDHVDGLDWVGRLLGAQGRVLPMAAVPLDITAAVRGLRPDAPGALSEVRGQVEVATTAGEVTAVALEPHAPPACPEAVQAVRAADWVVLGPGSWFTSVIPHLLVPGLAAALLETPARRILTLNLAEQPGETAGFTPAAHLRVLRDHAPDLAVDVVLVDESTSLDHRAQLEAAVDELGARLVVAPVRRPDGSARHDPKRLSEAYAAVLASAQQPVAKSDRR
jgi:uncharacterized cofD-like protein